MQKTPISYICLLAVVFLLADLRGDEPSPGKKNPVQTAGEDEETDAERRKNKEIGARVEAIAQALKAFKRDNGGKLPKRLRDLTPKYLAKEAALEIPHLKTSLPKGIPAYLVWMHGSGIEDPDDKNIKMVAFTPSESPGGGRFVIDNNFQVWWCGEGRFQDWIHGISQRELLEKILPTKVKEKRDEPVEDSKDTRRDE